MANQVPEQVYIEQQDGVYDVEIMPQQQPQQNPPQQYQQNPQTDQQYPQQQQMQYYPPQQPIGQYEMYPQQQQGQQQPYMGQPIYGVPLNPPNIEIILPSDASEFRYPIQIRCPYCNRVGMTTVGYRAGNSTICCCVLLCLTFWPCMILPFVMKDCKEAVSYCSSCTHIVGVSPAFS